MKKAEPDAFDARGHRRCGDAVEPLEDLPQLGHRYADAAIAHADCGGPRAGLRQLHGDRHLVARCADGVVHQVEHHRLEVVLVAQDARRSAVRKRRLVGQLARREAISRLRKRQAFVYDLREIDRAESSACLRRTETPGAQHLFDGSEQSIAVLHHHLVELLPLALVDLALLQRLQVQLHRRKRCLQLVGDGVDEVLVLLVPADFTDEKDRVEDGAGDDEGKRMRPAMR